MFSILLRTMLMAAQVLTGFWGNSTLCVRSDGTFCCVHKRASACGCCEHDHEAGASPHEPLHPGHSICAIVTTNGHPPCHENPAQDDHRYRPMESAAELPVSSNAPCGCRHVPIPSVTATASEKSSQLTSFSRRQGRSGIPQTDTCQMLLLSHCHATVCRRNDPGCQTVGLTLVPSTVIRC